MHVDTSKYLDDCTIFLQKLIQASSVNGVQNEQGIVDLIIKESEKLGLSYKIIEKEKDRPNVFVGNDFESRENLLLVAHLDTVSEGNIKDWQYDPFSGQIANGKIYGRGALDCKGGIAISLYTLKILKDLRLLDKAKFIGCVDEESGADSQIGLKYVLEQGLNAKGAVYTYGGGQVRESLTIGHRGLIRLWVNCEGEPAHSGSLEWQERRKGLSAIEGMMEFLEKLKGLSFNDEDKWFPGYKTTITPTLLEAGEGESMVPGKAKVLLDIRTLTVRPNEEIIQSIDKILDKMEGKWQFKVEVKNNIPAAVSPVDSEIVKQSQRLLEEFYGVKKPVLKGSGPANEGYMLITKGIPTVIGFGPQGEGFHSVNEYAEIDSIGKSLELLTKLVLER